MHVVFVKQVILQRLLHPSWSTLSALACTTSATRERRGGGVHTKEPIKVGWVHGCQPIRDQSPFTSKPALCRWTPTAVSVHLVFAINTDCFYRLVTFFYLTYCINTCHNTHVSTRMQVDTKSHSR